MRILLTLWHLLLASLHRSTSLINTSTAGIVFTIASSAVGLLVLLLIKLRSGGVTQMRQELKTTILEAAAVTIGVPILMWLLLVGVMIAPTIYIDHQDLLARIHALNSDKKTLNATNEEM